MPQVLGLRVWGFEEAFCLEFQDFVLQVLGD